MVLLGSIRKVKGEEYVFSQRDIGEEMYLILSGRVKILGESKKGDVKELNTLDKGELFGEVALLGEGIRSATVYAETDVELLRIDYNALERVGRRNPRISAKININIARTLSERIKTLTINHLNSAT